MNIRQVAVALAEIEPVADYKYTGDFEPDVIGPDRLDAPRRLVEQRHDLQTPRVVGGEKTLEVFERPPRIEDILDHEHIQTFDARFEIFGDANGAGGNRPRAVTRKPQEIHGDVELEVPDEVGHEDPGTFKDPDDVQRPAAEVLVDFPGHRADAPGDFLAGEKQFQPAGGPGLAHDSSSLTLSVGVC